MSAAVSHPIPVQTTEVLVLGAGLSGLRAALGAQEAAPDLPVVVICPDAGPSGSSFANRNNALGIQAPKTVGEMDAMTERVLALASPGRADPVLARTLAEESASRCLELQALGLAFREGRLPGCFWPDQATAHVFLDLAGAHAALARRFREQGGRFVHGTVTGLAQESGRGSRVVGAVCEDAEGALFGMAARAVVMALGGPAPLFPPHVAGPGLSGYSYALLHDAGARLDNVGFLQWMWYTDDRRFLRVQDLVLGTGQGPALVRDSQGGEVPFMVLLAERGVDRADARELALLRAGHCPYGYGLADNALDWALHAMAGSDGFVEVCDPEGAWLRAAPMAHAGNGGAVVDVDGRTDVPGLYAVGECATGMHGANRLGGAMVAATQVFGARAGRAAASEETVTDSKALREILAEFAASLPDVFDAAWGEDETILLASLHEAAVLGGAGKDAAQRAQQLAERLESNTDWAEPGERGQPPEVWGLGAIGFRLRRLSAAQVLRGVAATAPAA